MTNNRLASAILTGIACLVCSVVTVGVMSPLPRVEAAPTPPAAGEIQRMLGGYPLVVTNPQDGDTLVLDLTAKRWENGAGGGGGGLVANIGAITTWTEGQILQADGESSLINKDFSDALETSFGSTQGSWLRRGSSAWGVGATRLLDGSGAPEGVVSAPVGSVYMRTDGAASTTLYIKESGAGNTGWIAYGAASYSASIVVCSDPTAVDPLDGPVQTLSVSADTTFGFEPTSQSAGVSRSVALIVTCDGTNRALTFDSEFRWVGVKPSTILANGTAILRLWSTTNADTGVYASWTVAGDGSASSGVASPFVALLPVDSVAPVGTTSFAAFSSRNGHGLLAFDKNVDEEAALWEAVMPAGYSGADLNVKLFWAANAVTSGAVKWGVAFERIDASGLDIDADSFASQQTATTTTGATDGYVVTTTITLTQAQADGIQAGEPFRLKVVRHGDDAADTMDADAQLLRVTVGE